MPTTSSGIAFMVVLGAALVTVGLLSVFVFPDSARSRSGLSADVIGWISVGIGVWLLIAALREKN